MKYGKIYKTTGRIESVETFEAETIEEKINRIVNNKEPITDGAPIIYTERKEGVLPDNVFLFGCTKVTRAISRSFTRSCSSPATRFWLS